MSATFYLRKDQHVFIEDAEYTVVRADPLGETLLESETTGLRQGHSAYELVRMYLDGRLKTAAQQRAQRAPKARESLIYPGRP